MMIRLIFTLLLYWSAMAPNFAQALKSTDYSYGNLPADPQDELALAAYNNWKNQFVTACDQDLRVKFDNPDHTVSEGIGYGMLLAAYAQDRSTLDGLTRYYIRFKNKDGVMDWKIDGCSAVIGRGGAADAEFDYATAMIVADQIWGSDDGLDYAALAREMIGVIKSMEITSSHVPMAGPGYGGDYLTNPSYFAPGYFRLWGEFTEDQSYWNKVASKCYEILAHTRAVNNAVYGLVPDWCASSGEYSKKAAEVGYYESGMRYHYDASRVPWRIVADYLWYGTDESEKYLKACYEFTESQGGPSEIVDGYLLNGTGYGTYNAVAFSGAFAVTYMYEPVGQSKVNDAYNYLVNKAPNGYFNTTLHALYMFMITGNFWNPVNLSN